MYYNKSITLKTKERTVIPRPMMMVNVLLLKVLRSTSAGAQQMPTGCTPTLYSRKGILVVADVPSQKSSALGERVRES